MKRIFRWLGTAAFVLVASAVLLEVALRILALVPGKAAGLTSDPQVGLVGLPHVAVGEVKTNSAGFNDRESVAGAPPPKAVFIGDSFTFGITSFQQNFPYRVEAKLGGPSVFPVVNLGVPATGPHEYLAMLKNRALALQPEWIVVTLFTGNDIHQAHLHYRTLIFLGGARLVYDPLRLGTRWDEYFLPRVAYKFAQEVHRSAFESAETVRACAKSPEGAARITPFLLKVYAGELPVYEEPDDPLMHEAWDGMKHFITALADSAAGADVRVLFVIAPSALQLDPDLRASALSCLGKRSEGYDFSKPHRLMREYLEERGLPYVDLAQAFAQYPAAQTYALRDTHWSAFGNQVAADAIAAKLIELRAAPPSR